MVGPPPDSVLLGKYRVEATLGFGAMGIVLKARHVALDEEVAIKLIREDVALDEANVERFIREAKSAVKLKSEHVARIRDVGTFDDGKPYMVMELLQGVDLGRMLQEAQRIPRPFAVDLVLQACDAVAEAHSLGIIHRDLKPTNLFVTNRPDGSPLLKVLDFGISKAPRSAELALTQTASMLGTPTYMSPEQMRSARTVDPRSDIWSLGTVLYELVEGHPPFEAKNFAELCVQVTTEPPRPMAVAQEVSAIVHRALAKDLGARYQSVAELGLALVPFASQPEHARRAVMRIYRVLNLAPPAGFDPMPPMRPSPPAMENGYPSGAQTAPIAFTYQPGAPTVITPPRATRTWPLLLMVAILFSVGVVAGLIVTR